MLIKNVTYTIDPATGRPVAGTGKPLFRRYFNRQGRSLAPGQASPVSASISIVDVLQDMTFLKDTKIVSDALYVSSTWADYPGRVKIGTRTVALDGDGNLKNPVTGTPANPAAAQVRVFVTAAEKALLTKLLAACEDLYVTAAAWQFNPAGAGSDPVYIGLASSAADASYTFGDNMVLDKGSTYWEITTDDGLVYTGPVIGGAASAAPGAFTRAVGIGEVTVDAVEAVDHYFFTPTDGVAEDLGVKADIDTAGTVAILRTNAEGDAVPGVLSKGATYWQIAAGGQTYISTAAIAGAATASNYSYTETLGTVTAIESGAQNPDSLSETDTDMVASFLSVVETPELEAEATPAEPKPAEIEMLDVSAQSAETAAAPELDTTISQLAAKGKGKGRKSLASLEAANKG